MQTARELLRATLETRLSQRYRIGEELGFGGMAVVYRAENLELGRSVALKVLRPDRIIDPDITLRFRTEALAIARLTHPHIIAIHARGEDPELMWFEMDYVDGGSLADLFEKGTVDWARMMRFVAQAASGLHSAHTLGVIHRDIKPSNLLLTSSHDHLVITDFGIAKILGRTTLTETGVTLGTVAYMSPEQMMAQEVTAATDQYSLGAVAFEGLTGQQPFHADSTGQLTLEKLRRPIPSILEGHPDVPAGVEALITRMLAPDPAGRWPDLRAVQRIAEELAVSGRSPAMEKIGTGRHRRVRRRAWATAGLALVGLGAWGAVQLQPWNRQAEDGTDPPATETQATTPVDSTNDGLMTANTDSLTGAPTGDAQPVTREAGPVALRNEGEPSTTPSNRRGQRDAAADPPLLQQPGPDTNTAAPVTAQLPTTGTLRIASSLPGTFLYLNGSTSPFLLREEFQDIEVPAGEVTMVVRSNQAGCTPREDALTIRPGEVRALRRTAVCPES